MSRTELKVAQFLFCAFAAILAVALIFQVFGHDPYTESKPMATAIAAGLNWLMLGALIAVIVWAMVLAVKGPRVNRIAASWLIAGALAMSFLAQVLMPIASIMNFKFHKTPNSSFNTDAQVRRST